MKSTKKLVFISLLTSMGLALGLFESVIPLPFIAPGAKLGLSNIVILITLTTIGFKEALLVGVLKSIILALVTGSVTSVFYSLTGGLLSGIVMYIIYKYFSNIFSLIGVSIFGALAHNFGQITVASLILSNFKIFAYYPILTLMSLFTGFFVGITANFVNTHFKKGLKNILETGD